MKKKRWITFINKPASPKNHSDKVGLESKKAIKCPSEFRI
jgi:hypothetical protein